MYAQGPSRFLLAEYERALWVMPEASVLMVENDPAKVEADLAEGRLSCPSCRGVLAAWSFARRRYVRTEAGPLELRPRRGRCRGCAKTHVLLPDALVCRRVDAVAVIGSALLEPDSAFFVGKATLYPASAVRRQIGMLLSRLLLVSGLGRLPMAREP